MQKNEMHFESTDGKTCDFKVSIFQSIFIQSSLIALDDKRELTPSD